MGDMKKPRKKRKEIPHSMFTGIPLEDGKQYQFMNSERMGIEKGLGEVIQQLKRAKRLPKYIPSEEEEKKKWKY